MDRCRVEDCESPVFVKKHQLCQSHYHRFKRHGDPLVWKRRQRHTCAVDGCGSRVVGDGLCDLHYRRQRRYGTTDRPERPTVCSVEGCGDRIFAHVMCERHYRQTRNGTDIHRACLFCGTTLLGTAHGRQRYCSKECHEKELYQRRIANNRGDWLRRQYGITVAEYNSRLAAQGGCCAICRSSDPKGRRASPYFHVDHDHATGAVRGLLCAPCNTGIGQFGDDPRVLEAAVAYLRAGVAAASL